MPAPIRTALLGLVLLGPLLAEEPDPEVMEAFRVAIQAAAADYDPIVIDAADPGTAVDFAGTVGDLIVRNPKDPGTAYDGFSFTFPAAAAGRDLVWYVNAPQAWGGWYIVPAEGELRQGFRNWLQADRLFAGIDSAAETDRFRFLQTLDADYFVPGERYILWFSSRVEGEPEPGELRGRIAFAEPQEEWSPTAVAAALGLEEASAEEQITALDSRGGRALLEPGWFDRGYAERQIDAMLDARRDMVRMRGGMFIKMEVAVPPCRRSPTMATITERFGPPDFARSPSERSAAWGGEAPDGDDELVILHYDHFGFEVRADDRQGKVLRVHALPTDYRVLAPPAADAEPGFAWLATDNLMVFHRDGAECGRIYYFLEAGKDPVVITQPPPGTYRSGDTVLEHLGLGAWTQEDRRADGTLARRMPLSDNRYHGDAEWFHGDGTVSMRLPFRLGKPHGEAVRYDEAGEVIDRTNYRDGERVD